MTAALRALADFAPRLEAMASPGRVEGPERIGERTYKMPHAVLDTTASDFVNMLYDEEWVEPFDWSTWVGTDEAQRLLNDPAAMEIASVEQIRRILTACVRRDRFCEGFLLEMFENGVMLRAAKRAQALLAEAEGRRP